MTIDPSTRLLTFDPERNDTSAVPDDLVGVLAAKQAILLLAAPRAREDRWAARAAVGIARQLARMGSSVILADLSFNEGVLHQLLGVANGEGLGDVLLFGASAEHVALQVPDAAFRLIPAGAYVPDEADVLAHPGWRAFLAQLQHDGDLLLAYVPEDAPGVSKLAQHFAAAIVLAGDADAEAVRESAAALTDVFGVVVTAGRQALAPLSAVPVEATAAITPAAPPEEAPAEPPEPEPAPGRTFETVRLPRDREREALIADLRARQRAERAQPDRAKAELHASPLVGGPETPRLSEPPARAPQREAAPHRRRTAVFLSIAVVLFASAIAGVWHFGRVYMRGREAAPPATPQESPVQGTVPLAGEPAGEPLPYSVAIEAHQDLPTAVRRVASLERADTASGFYIAPILVDSALYYRVMAGPVGDSADAASVMQRLIARGLKTGGTEWDIRATPYAFLLGEYELREQAEQRAEQIHTLNIPAYVIEVPYTNGPPRYYLYAGAYSGAAEAEVMRQLLRNAGLATNLVERTGRSSS